ncbi:MAG: J domain-containing protein [Clostridium sp.]
MNPYEILGVKSDATQAEIKSAYRALIKQYHPDQYSDNPLRELAEVKMREINGAYDALTKGNSNSNSSYSGTSNSYSNSSDNNSLNEIKRLIQGRQFKIAENKLNAISTRNAEWNFLYGIVLNEKGWYDGALKHIQTAVNMDPNNFEYKQALNTLNQKSKSYGGNYYRQTGRNNNDSLDCCMNLWCLDSICECFGGDIIGCC